MAIQRTITCDICGKTESEKIFGSGWKGWGQIIGKMNDKGDMEFGLCPEHLDDVFIWIKEYQEVLNYGVDKSHI